MAMPTQVRIFPSSPQERCIDNLRLIDGAIQEWALEHHKGDADVPTWADLSSYLRNRNQPRSFEMPIRRDVYPLFQDKYPDLFNSGHALPVETNDPLSNPRPYTAIGSHWRAFLLITGVKFPLLFRFG